MSMAMEGCNPTRRRCDIFTGEGEDILDEALIRRRGQRLMRRRRAAQLAIGRRLTLLHACRIVCVIAIDYGANPIELRGETAPTRRAIVKTFVLQLAASAAFLVASPGAGYAAMKVCLDNNPNGGSVANTGTTNLLTVSVKIKGSNGCQNATTWIRIGGTSVNEVTGCEAVYGVYNPTSICAIKVETDGTDWFWLDQIEIFHYDNSQPFPQGTGARFWSNEFDNTTGYCISQDTTEGHHCTALGTAPVFSWTVQ